MSFDDDLNIEQLTDLSDEDMLRAYKFWQEKNGDTVPDGIMDVSTYIDKIKAVIGIIDQFDNLDDANQRSSLMLLLIKTGADGLDGAIALAYVLTVVLSNLDDAGENFFRAFKEGMNSAISHLEDNRHVPYWGF